MPRLGELLVASGLLAAEQVEQALRAQVMWGGRLGTNLVELHYLELDPLSKALARQHRLPAALARHFERADPQLQRLLSADFAERFSCIPLLRMGPDGHIAIASLGPLAPRQLAIIADELAVDVERLVPAVAPELRIRYQLERVYSIRRAARFLRARGESIPPFPAFQILIQTEAEIEIEGPPSLPLSTQEIAAYRPDDPRALDRMLSGEAALHTETATERSPPAVAAERARSEPDEYAIEPDDYATEPDDDLIPVEVLPPGAHPDELDDLALHASPDEDAVPSASAEAAGRERRRYVRTIADAPASDSERQALLGRIAIRKVAVGPASRGTTGATLGEATRAIRRSTGRDRVGDLVVDTLDRFAPACDAAIVLVLRGATAIGWKGFVRGGGALGEIAVPLEDGGLVPRVVALNVTLRKPWGELDAIDRLLLASMGRQTGDLVVVPISIADQVMCVVAIAAAENAPIASAEPIAAAAGAAFARLMRDASR